MENNDIDEIPPELEDLSEELGQIRKTRGQKEEQESEIKVNVVSGDRESKKSENQTNHKNSNVFSNNYSSEQEFCSFLKKGFLKRSENSNSAKISDSTKQSPRLVDLTHIKSNTDQREKVFEQIKTEVKSNRETASVENKKSLLNNIVEKKDEWMNQELLMKISKKPNLMKCFMDPRFTEVITTMQKDPQKAMSQFGHIKEFSEFIKEFSQVMAEHFSELGKEKENLQFDKETQEIMNDTKIKPIIYKLQTEGKLDIEEIQRDPEVANKVKKLIDKGIFRIQKESDLNNK